MDTNKVNKAREVISANEATFSGGGDKAAAWVEVWKKIPFTFTRRKMGGAEFCDMIALIAISSFMKQAGIESDANSRDYIDNAGTLLRALGVENLSAVGQCWDKITVEVEGDKAPYLLHDAPALSKVSIKNLL